MVGDFGEGVLYFCGDLIACKTIVKIKNRPFDGQGHRLKKLRILQPNFQISYFYSIEM